MIKNLNGYEDCGFYVDKDRIKLWQIELNLLDGFKEICKENDLSYFLIGGSAIGAVRHKGFIPWDDDMDIGMLRPDFERFIATCKEKLGRDMYLEYGLDSENKEFYSFCRLRDRNSTAVIRSQYKRKGVHGVFIEIYPFDKVPKSRFIRKIQWKKDLSVQVHPTDAYAQEHENGQLGKTEMWYVLDASKDAKLVYGLKREHTEQQMRDAIANGTLMKDLQWVPVKKDDLFFIEAGTIHAIGAGALVAEIQENSNLTYRLYDYDRVGKDGKKRELHIDKALDVANLKGSAEPKQPLRVLKYRQGIAAELLTRCKYFEVYRMIVNTERRQKVHYRADEIAFRVLLCVDGCGTISYEGGNLPFYKGDCIFVPADSEVLTIHGQAQFLDVRG